MAANTRAWRLQNPEAVKLSRQKHRATKKAKETAREYAASPAGKACKKRYAQSEKGKISFARVAARRNAKIRATKPPRAETWDALRARLFAEYAGECIYCGLPAETLDHADPIALGGEHSASNLVPCCLACNVRKGDKPLFVWLMERAAKAA